ncbi:MAG: cupredoxin family copper-binding protein [Nitrososphaera sp.]|jgi:plastocyanin
MTNTKNIFSIALAAALIAGAVSVISLNAMGSAAYADDKMPGQMATRDHRGEGKIWGTIASIQNDDKGQPAWISSGIWRLSMRPQEGNTTTAPDAKFIARFSMVKLDGTSMHGHAISDFALKSASTSGNITTLTGNVTMTMKDAPQKNIPVTIKIMNSKTISIMLDPAVNSHLGNTPLYGTVAKANEGYHAMSHMSAMPGMPAQGRPTDNDHRGGDDHKEDARVEIVTNAANKLDKAYSPNPLTVKAGTEVTWKNADSSIHTVTQGNPTNGPTDGGFDSKLMNPKKEFKFKFDTAGTFDYFCQLHPTMVGKVTVE